MDVTVPTTPSTVALIASHSTESRPRIGGDYVAFQYFNGTDFDIQVYELSSGSIFTVAGGSGNQLDPAVSDGKVVFTDVTTGMVKYSDIATASTFDIDFGQDPDIDGNRIVYSKDVGDGNYDIFLYNMESGLPPENITNRPGNQMRPTIVGNYISFDDDSAGN